MNNLTPMTLDEQKRVMLDILKEFVRFCDEHDLMYYLDAGTLIGAVRHKGYIPWDDDIDVNMPQPDYDDFCRLMRDKDGYMTSNIVVEFPDTTLYPYLKISDNRTLLVEFPDKNPMEVGVYIDVFPKYGIPDKSWRSKLICKISYYMDLLHWFNVYTIKCWKRSKHNALKRFVGTIADFCVVHPHWPVILQDRILHAYAKHYPLSECQYVTTLTNGEFHKLAPKKCFDGYQMLEFEDGLFKGPKDYDTYLRCLYKGDYMQLPPEDKRLGHKTEAYWR